LPSIDDDETTFYPSATPIMEFDTPIRQIEALPHHITSSGPTSLIVRTYGKTTFLKAVSTLPYTENPRQFRPKVVPLASIDSSSTEDQPVVDMALNMQGTFAFLVTNKGQVHTTKFKDNGAMIWSAI
jgi:hypothetical protein